MKILFDQNARRPLARYLTEHIITRAAQLGWEEVKNGDLLLAAERAALVASYFPARRSASVNPAQALRVE